MSDGITIWVDSLDPDGTSDTDANWGSTMREAMEVFLKDYEYGYNGLDKAVEITIRYTKKV